MRQMEGVVIGIVKELDEPLGRLRADLPWLGKGVRSYWAPVAAPMSGGKRGVFLMPEVGDEVLIAFEHGNFKRPYVVGFLWNGVDKAPETTRYSRVIITPGGHSLRFEDKDGEKKIILKTAGKRSITLDDKPGHERIEIKSGDHTILMDETPASAAITVETAGHQKIELHDVPSSAKVSISAGVSLEMNAQGVTLTVPSGNVNVNASACPVSVHAASATIDAPTTTFTGNVTIAGTLAVSMPATLSAGAIVSGTVQVTGPVSITGITNVTGMLTATALVSTSTVVTPAVVSASYTPGVGNLL